jgi:hypothetical protein
MSSIAIEPRTSSAWGFAAVTLAVMLGSAAAAGAAPLAFSVVIVFLFAGPHNWMEARYFLSRLPARWVGLRVYFATALAGAFGLTAASVWLAVRGLWWDEESRAAWLGVWNVAVLLWVLALIGLRGRSKPRRDWRPALVGVALLLPAAWSAPRAWGLVLAFGHPLVGLWILDRELRRRPDWRRGYRLCLAGLPVVLAALAWALADAAPLAGEDAGEVARRICRQAGGSVVPGVSSRLLVAAHAFLEMLHYGVWLLAVPLVSLPAGPWRLDQIPVVRRSPAWRFAAAAVLAAGGAAVLLLWGCFLLDYAATWELYFTVALVHVLAEVPFLLRSL